MCMAKCAYEPLASCLETLLGWKKNPCEFVSSGTGKLEAHSHTCTHARRSPVRHPRKSGRPMKVDEMVRTLHLTLALAHPTRLTVSDNNWCRVGVFGDIHLTARRKVSSVDTSSISLEMSVPGKWGQSIGRRTYDTGNLFLDACSYLEPSSTRKSGIPR